MNKPVRVLHVIGIMNRGGAETMIMNLYRNIDREKIQFDFVENSSKPAVFDDEIQALGGKIYRCPHYNGKNHVIYIRWWKDFFAAHKGEYPIVHGHLGSTAAIYLSIAKKYDVYTIAHSHSISSLRSLHGVAYSSFAYPTRFIANHFFACSMAAAISRYGKKVANNRERCTVLPNAIDMNKFVFNKYVRQKMRTLLGITDSQFVIGSVGRFVKPKNHLFLVDVFEEIHKRNDNMVLLLVGDGGLRAQIEAHIAEKGLQDYVIFTGVKSNVQDYYQAMDVFLMPSLYEGLPLSLVEAQTAGLPCCVSTAVPGESAITELVQFRPLTDSAAEWGDWVLKRCKEPRQNVTSRIRQAGYDISTTSKWLESYYVKVVKNRV